MAAVIETRGLTKYYGPVRGIVDVNLQVHEGEIFGFLGPNGAGKTTTIRLFLDLIRPTEGEVRIFGLEVRRHSLEIRRRVGYLPGELALYEDLTGRQLLEHLAGLRNGVDRRRVEELAERLEAELDRPLRELSHGNKQKIGLIQAFMADPELLILDEPATGLDPLVQQTFYELLAEAKARGCTVFLSSHILPEVERVCDRVGIIREGRLVAVETVASLKARAGRRVEVTFAEPVPPEVFQGLPGVQELEVRGRRLRGFVRGEMAPFLRALAALPVVDLLSREPSLEEVFLAFYAAGAEDREGGA